LISFSVLSASGFVKARIVLTGSMEPVIKPGDIVLLAPTPRTQPELGDIVAYTARRFSGESVGIFTHRIIGGDPINGWLMKGDNNPTPDVQKPKAEDISGVVFFVIPWIGKLMAPKMLMVLIPVGVGIWLIIDTLKGDS
jgi:signal peptidase